MTISNSRKAARTQGRVYPPVIARDDRAESNFYLRQCHPIVTSVYGFAVQDASPIDDKRH
jgi:hypothetical protein